MNEPIANDENSYTQTHKLVKIEPTKGLYIYSVTPHFTSQFWKVELGSIQDICWTSRFLHRPCFVLNKAESEGGCWKFRLRCGPPLAHLNCGICFGRSMDIFIAGSGKSNIYLGFVGVKGWI